MMFQHIVFRKTVNNTPTNTARTELHSMITLHLANTRAQGRTAQGCTNGSLKECHPRVMSHSLPHLTLSTCTSSFFYLPLLSFQQSLRHTHKTFGT